MSNLSDEVQVILGDIWDKAQSQSRLSEILQEVDPRLRWEAGPISDQLAYLAISPNRYPELLAITAKLVESLPPIAGWIFLDAKPRKNWTSRKVKYHGVEYCFDEWRYRLTMFNDGKFFDIDFFGCEEGLSEDVRDWLSVFIASSELGERLFMEAIDRVSASPKHAERGPTSPIGSLFDHVNDLLRRSPAGDKT